MRNRVPTMTYCCCILWRFTWESRELSEPSCTPGFFEWFQKYKADVFKCSTIRPVCEETRLWNPPEVFTTNVSHSMPWSSQRSTIRKVNLTSSLTRWDAWKWIDQQKEVECAPTEEVEKWCQSSSTVPSGVTGNLLTIMCLRLASGVMLNHFCSSTSRNRYCGRNRYFPWLQTETPKDPDHYHGTHPSFLIELPSFVDSVVTPKKVFRRKLKRL